MREMEDVCMNEVEWRGDDWRGCCNLSREQNLVIGYIPNGAIGFFVCFRFSSFSLRYQLNPPFINLSLFYPLFRTIPSLVLMYGCVIFWIRCDHYSYKPSKQKAQ